MSEGIRVPYTEGEKEMAEINERLDRLEKREQEIARSLNDIKHLLLKAGIIIG